MQIVMIYPSTLIQKIKSNLRKYLGIEQRSNASTIKDICFDTKCVLKINYINRELTTL